MAYAKFDGYEIPKVYEAKMKPVYIGESARTAGGKLRRDGADLKRVWSIKCRAVPPEKVEPLLNYLKSTLYAEGSFWLKEFGNESNVILAMVDPESIDLETVGVADENGVWRNDGKKLSLTIEEV